MDRPASPELDAIMTAADAVRDLEAQVVEAKRQLASTVDGLQSIADLSERLRVAVYAYWFAPETSANQLALLSVGKSSSPAMLKRFGTVSVGVNCDRCNKDLPITSRSMMADVLREDAADEPRPFKRFKLVCRDCRAAEDARRTEAYLRLEVEREERRQVLSQMNYADYLETAEWKLIRSSVMEGMLHERGNLTCEICSERDGLAFVHSQFDPANGREAVSLLCTICSDALAQAGKLAHPPLPANHAPRIELDLVERNFRSKRYGDHDDGPL